MSLTYASYLHLDELLRLQQPRSSPPEHDEMIFIVVHQAYELWFKLQLHELEKIQRDFRAGHTYEAIATFKRVRTIMKLMVEQVDVIETLTPLSFNSFRARLETSSGFQSSQFRELEYLLGYKRPELLRYQQHDPDAQERLKRRLDEPSVGDAFHAFLVPHGVTYSESEEYLEALLKLYRERNDLRILIELMTDFDEGLQEWRYRHIKLVERTIGAKHGTGGSPGVPFLKESLFKPIFHDLWAIRHQM
jgi:tryptophan 2,3-dioxygenase